MINIRKHFQLCKPINFRCFTRKQDIELFLPDFLRGYNVFGYNKNEDTFWAKKQCKNSYIYISINILKLSIRESNVEIITLCGFKTDVEKEVKIIYDKIIEYSNILEDSPI